MRTILILIAILAGAIILIANTQKAKRKTDEENFSGLVDGATNIASSIVLLVFVIVGVILVVALVLLKKTADNPDRAFEVASKGADVYAKIKRT